MPVDFGLLAELVNVRNPTPPVANDCAKSVRIFPVLWMANGLLHGDNASDNPAAMPELFTCKVVLTMFIYWCVATTARTRHRHAISSLAMPSNVSMLKRPGSALTFEAVPPPVKPKSNPIIKPSKSPRYPTREGPQHNPSAWLLSWLHRNPGAHRVGQRPGQQDHPCHHIAVRTVLQARSHRPPGQHASEGDRLRNPPLKAVSAMRGGVDLEEPSFLLHRRARPSHRDLRTQHRPGFSGGERREMPGVPQRFQVPVDARRGHGAQITADLTGEHP